MRHVLTTPFVLWFWFGIDSELIALVNKEFVDAGLLVDERRPLKVAYGLYPLSYRMLTLPHSCIVRSSTRPTGNPVQKHSAVSHSHIRQYWHLQHSRPSARTLQSCPL